MEQPPGSLDHLQPQDVSTPSTPTAIDSTRKEEEHVLVSTPHDILRVVKSPGWYPDSRTPMETGSSEVPPGEQLQPDNALSHTTVTVSYVSRSHVFSAHNSLSQHLPRYSVAPISKFSFHPHGDTDNRLEETSYRLNQHYSEEMEEPVDLALQSEPFHPFLQAPSGPDSDIGGGFAQEPVGLNDEDVSSDGFTYEPSGDDEDKIQENPRNGLENGQRDGWSSSGALSESSPETLTPAREEDEKSRSSDVLLVMSEKQDSEVVSHSVGPRNLCSPSREYRSPLEDPISPSATSLDDVEDVILLPQTSSSPSADITYPERDEEGLERPTHLSSCIIPDSMGLDSSNVTKEPTPVWKPSEPLTEDLENSKVVFHVNGNAKALETTLKERKLPARSSRGTRLEAIVMNINSSRYKVSGRIHTNKKTVASKPTAPDLTVSPSKRSASLSKRRGKVKTPLSGKQKVTVKKSKRSNIKPVSCKDSTSVSEPNNKLKTSRSVAPTKTPQLGRSKREPVQPPQINTLKSRRKASALQASSKKEPEPRSQPEPSVEMKVPRFSSPPPQSKSPKNDRGRTKSESPGSKVSPTVKTKPARTPKRRRKKPGWSQTPSIFSPKEPEIKLRYVNYKEERRDPRLDAFSPFVHVERQESSPSLCTLINYPEEVKVPPKKGQLQQAFVSPAVPSTSCLRLGRLSNHSQHQRALTCCLCSRSANAMDLGDLHGPYYPEGYLPSAKAPAGGSGLKEDEDDYSDSDSSSCSGGASSWGLMRAAQLKQKGLLGRRRWAGEGRSSPAAKRPRSDISPADVQDWYSPPVLPQEPCEYWLHEDCTIWSAGVFLVKGRVYGLEEAVRVAQETMCSACHTAGATLGCFFKGCANKYHYRCALESDDSRRSTFNCSLLVPADCVLVEDNFSMKCKKHKNKTFKAPPGSRRGVR